MASFDHESLGKLFDDRELVRELLALCAGIELTGVTFESASIDLTQVKPTTYLADRVTRVRDATGAITAAIVIEIQRTCDGGKRWSWPVYVATLREREQCPVTLLVIATEDSVARWARPDSRCRRSSLARRVFHRCWISNEHGRRRRSR